VTKDIEIGLGLPFEIAEEMKKKYGTVLPVDDGKPNDDFIEQNGHKIPYARLCEIIRDRMEELLRLIIIELPESERSTLVPGGLVLTGGSSNLVGIASLGKQVLKMPVRIGMPQHISGLIDQLNDPAFATAIGLLLWGTKPKSNVRLN